MSRVVFILVTVFWLTMNILLWQTEFGSRKSGGTVPVATVWEKILTSADDSSLTVFHRGKLVGACHLRTAVGEEWSKIGDENMPSAPPSKGRGYDLRLEGSAVVPQLTNRVRFNGELKLGKAREWQELSGRIILRPVSWEIHSIAAERSVHLKARGTGQAMDVVLHFSDFNNPAVLAYKLLGPGAADLASEAGLPTAPMSASSASVGVKWEAEEDLARIGRTSVQVYRLHTRVLDRYELKVIVSRAGEILRVDLPGEVTMINDRLAASSEGPNRKPSAKIEDPLSDLSTPWQPE